MNLGLQVKLAEMPVFFFLGFTLQIFQNILGFEIPEPKKFWANLKFFGSFHQDSPKNEGKSMQCGLES